MNKIEDSIEINGVKYIKEGSVLPSIKSIALVESLVGKYVICRTVNEGINAGTVLAADETGVVLTGCRRLYYHRPKSKSLSWYEGVAVSGLDEDSKVSGIVSMKVIIEDYSLTECTEEARVSICEFVSNAQN